MVQKVSELRANPLANDPDVHIPEAVRRAAAAADAAQLAANPQPEPPPTPHTPQPDFITIAQPEVPRLPGQVPLTIEPAPPAPQPQPPTAPLEGEALKYKNQYEAMLGRHRDASAQLQQANSRIEALENMLASMQSAPRAAPPTAPQPEPQTFLTKKDEEEMGPEMIDFVRRVAKEQVAPLSALQQELANLKNQLQGTTQDLKTNARQDMHNKLDQALPIWNEINHHPDFHAWLALQDPFSGVNRKKLLTTAYAQNDTARVLAIFKGFVSETATSPAIQDPVPTPASEQPVRPSLADLAAPGRARTAATPQQPAEKQIIRTSDINAFYAAVRRGDYRGREELKAQLEAELHAAMAEGRVVQNT